MKYFYLALQSESQSDLKTSIELAASRLEVKLRAADFSSLNISDYSRRYLQAHLRKLRWSLQKYAYLLYLAINEHPVALSEIVFVDYGGGTGLQSLMAKELGVGTVVYNDIYDISCHDARIIGEEVNCPADHYVHGGIKELTNFFDSQHLVCHSIASYDVIEHIYSIEEFIQTLAKLCGGTSKVVLASGANPQNPFIKAILTRQHHSMEYENRQKLWGHKERDTHRAFLIIRQEIIAELAPELRLEEVEHLAQATRGLNAEDIEICIKEYLDNGVISYLPDHSTNTCDPYTGNWAERLMDTDYLRSIFSQQGFDIEILNGYYGEHPNIPVRLIGRALNEIMVRIPRHSLRLAPYYIIYSRSQKLKEAPLSYT